MVCDTQLQDRSPQHARGSGGIFSFGIPNFHSRNPKMYARAGANARNNPATPRPTKQPISGLRCRPPAQGGGEMWTGGHNVEC